MSSHVFLGRDFYSLPFRRNVSRAIVCFSPLPSTLFISWKEVNPFIEITLSNNKPQFTTDSSQSHSNAHTNAKQKLVGLCYIL